MAELETNNIRADMIRLIKDKFQSLSIWSRIEGDIAVMCSGLSEPNTLEKKGDFIKQMIKIKEYLKSFDILNDDLKFMDDEIELHEQSKTISLYQEKDDDVPKSVIDAYSRLGRGTEGIVGIPQDYNYTQLEKLATGVFLNTGLVKFYISQEKMVYGKIVAEIYEYSQEVPIVKVVESKRTDKDTGEPVFKGLRLFGRKVPGNEYNIIKEVNLSFYVYRFISEDNVEYILLTTTQCEIGDYIITGVQTECEDFKSLTDSAKLPTKLPFLFAKSVQNRIIKYHNHEQFKEKLDNLEITKDSLFEYPFSIEQKGKSWVLIQPLWYKWLTWAWLTHASKGIFNNYPLHLMVIGPKMSGKSLLLNALHKKSKETRSVFSGSSSTLKHLVPSFKYNPARLGYLAESNRFSYCDEFLRCLVSTRSNNESGGIREESVGIMNDLLEHQKREAGSGVSKVNVNMTSRIFATTNPIREIKNVETLIKSLDESFLSRWLIYYQTDAHVQMIRRSIDSALEQKDFNISVNDWISILDYLHTFSANYDLGRISNIHKEIPRMLTENLNKHYDARHMHHIECLMDGIIKTRCLFEKDMSFKAKEEDYDMLRSIWSNVIKSWINLPDVSKMDRKERINFLPEDCQFIFGLVSEGKNGMQSGKLRELSMDVMSAQKLYESITMLEEMGLIHQDGTNIYPYYVAKLNREY